MGDRGLTDDEASKLYEDADHREPAASGRRIVRPRGPLAHVPVRFPRDLIEEVQGLAGDDGVSVSVWIRRAVKQELARRRDQTV